MEDRASKCSSQPGVTIQSRGGEQAHSEQAGFGYLAALRAWLLSAGERQ